MKVSISDIEQIHDDEVLEIGTLTISRAWENVSILNVPTKMWVVNKFQVFDPFGIIIWEGNAESASKFVNGFNGDIQ